MTTRFAKQLCQVKNNMKVIDRIPKELLDAVNEFSKKLEWARRLPIYEIHKWWARRYSGIVRLFLAFSELDLKFLKKVSDYSFFVRELYFNPPKVNKKRLLDPFAGGGTVLVEGSVLGYESFGIEINKLPCLFLESLRDLSYIDFEVFEYDIKSIAELLSNLWKTKCYKGHDALIIHTFLAWKNGKGELQVKFNKIKDGVEKTYFCEKCGKVYSHRSELSLCIFCGNKFNKHFTKLDFFELSPYAIEYYCPTCNHRSIKKIACEDIYNYWQKELPSTLKIPELNETKRLLNAGFKDFSELLTPRQFMTIKSFLNYFQTEPYKKLAKILASDAIRSCSILAYYSSTYTKVIPAFVIKSYWLPLQPVELNPIAFKVVNGKLLPLGRGNIISAFRKLKRAKDFMLQQKIELKYRIYNGPAQEILPRMEETFDVIFTDPPYGDYQYYSDLSLFNLSIIGEIDENALTQLLQKEIVLRHKKNLREYKKGLYDVFYHATKRLTEKGKLILTFHHPDENLLYAFLEIFKYLPVELHAIYPVFGESSGKLVSRKLYLDLIFVFGKSKQNIHYVFTTHKMTTYDDRLQNSIIKLIDFYEE